LVAFDGTRAPTIATAMYGAVISNMNFNFLNVNKLSDYHLIIVNENHENQLLLIFEFDLLFEKKILF